MTHKPTVSVVIPYCNRPDHLRLVLMALTEQDADMASVEIIIGCTEQDSTLREVIPPFRDRLRISCATEDGQWNVSRARNLGFTRAAGDILLLLDCDMLLPRSFITTLCDGYDPALDDTAIIGQMLGYDANANITSCALDSYERYRDLHLAGNSRQGLPEDQRWKLPKNIPWSMCRSALIAIPRRLIGRHDLYFDQAFRGWGAEDLEWGYRLTRCNIGFVFADELWGIHLPHRRDVQLNFAQQEANYCRFLTKWPCFEVEVVTRFGDYLANNHYQDLTSILRSVRGTAASVNVLELSVNETRHLVFGAIEDANGRILNMEEIGIETGISGAHEVTRLPLVGLRLPYSDEYAHSAYLMKALRKAPDIFLDLVCSEAKRVAKRAIHLY